jgi:hypothetical protein
MNQHSQRPRQPNPPNNPEPAKPAAPRKKERPSFKRPFSLLSKIESMPISSARHVKKQPVTRAWPTPLLKENAH